MSVAKRFESLFRAALDRKTAERGLKVEEKAFYELNAYCLRLSTRQQIDACLERYLAIYRDYRPAAVREGRAPPNLMQLPAAERNTERKSLRVLYILLKRRIGEFKDGAAVLEQLRDGGLPRSELKERFDQLEDDQRREIVALVPPRPTGMLDVLRDAHRRAEGGASPTMAQLWAVSPVPHDASLRGEYDERVKACRDAWAAAWEVLATAKQDNVALLEQSIDAFDRFVRRYKERRSEPELFQILKWSRDALEGRQYVDEALYLQVAIVVYMMARQTKASSRLGLTPDEQHFLLAPLHGTRKTPPVYAETHVARFKTFAPAPNDFASLNRYHLRLLLLAHHRNVSLTTDAQAQRVYDRVSASTKADLEKRAIDTRGMATADINKGVFPLGEPVGVGTGRFVPIYKNDQERIFIEYMNVPGILFDLGISAFTSKVEAIPRLLVWEYNKHLLVLIPKLFALLGYTFTIATGGFSALVREILEDVAQAAVEELAKEFDIKGGDGGGIGGDVLALARGKRRIVTPKGVGKASKRLGTLGEEEARRTAAKAVREGGEAAEEQLVKLGRRPLKPPTPPIDPATHIQANVARMRTPQASRRNVLDKTQPARTDPRLIEAVRQERAANTDLSAASFESNVAAVRITVNGRPETLVALNTPHRLHSEAHLTNQIAEIRDRVQAMYGKADVKVLEFFSEREPCYGSCRILLKKAFPQARVSFLIPDANTAGKNWWDVKELLGRSAEALRRAWLGGG